MKNMKTKTTILSLLMLSLNSLIQPSVRADIGLGDVWGTAWTIGNIIVGTTTLHPAYKVESYSWYFHHTALVPGTPGSILRTMKWDRITGLHFFYTKGQSSSSVTIENTDPFIIDSINKLDITCGGGEPIFEYTFKETHSEFVWLAQVESTGLWPDNGPWKVWLKAGGYKISCTPALPQTDYFFWVPASVTKSQGQSVSVGKPNSILYYPFYLASDFYK